MVFAPQVDKIGKKRKWCGTHAYPTQVRTFVSIIVRSLFLGVKHFSALDGYKDSEVFIEKLLINNPREACSDNPLMYEISLQLLLHHPLP